MTNTTTPMNRIELLSCLDALDWTVNSLAARTGWPPRSAARWGTGRFAVPDELAQWLRMASAFMTDNPPPMRPNDGEGSDDL